MIEADAGSAPFVLNAVELNDPRFDQSCNTVRAKVFICSSQRTGSFLLCRAMIHHGLGVPHEYWNPTHIAELGPRFGIAGLADGRKAVSDRILRGDYIAAVLTHRTVAGVFAAKVQWWEYRDYLDNIEGHHLFRDGRFVHLYREDLVDQAVSLHISQVTGRWGLDRTITTGVQAAEFFDADAINRRMDEMADADKSWRSFFERNGIEPLLVSYEQLVADPARVVHTIAARFDLRLRDVPDYSEARVFAPRNEQDEPSSRDLRAWFLAHR